MPQQLEIYRKKSGFTSNDKLAEALLERHEGLDWGVKARSLGVKLGLIDKGETGWWQKRPALAKAMSQYRVARMLPLTEN